MPMTPLQSRMHTEVCLVVGLTACLCGAYARVGEEYAREQMAEHDNCITEMQADALTIAEQNNELHDEKDKLLDAARERETRLREALMLYVDDWYAGGDLHDDGCPEDDTCECEKIAKVRAALSAGAREK